MTYETLVCERTQHVARVTLNRPEKLNAMNRQMLKELVAVAQEIATDPSVRAVLLGAAGRGFCSGADIAGVIELFDRSPNRGEAVRLELQRYFNPAIRAWYTLAVPVVVAVNGVAAGAGMSLALVGDLVVASESATFIQLFAPRLGLGPDMGSTYFLPRLIGTARTKALTLLGEPLAAKTAVTWGLIHATWPDGELADQALELALRLARGPTRAFAQIKEAVNQGALRAFDEQLACESDLQCELANSADFQEGLRAFGEKREPVFLGV